MHTVLIFYTTWVRGVAYRKQLSGPKLMGVWPRAACKNLGPLFISATVEASNIKFGIQLGLGEEVAKKQLLQPKLAGVQARAASKKLGPPIYFGNR